MNRKYNELTKDKPKHRKRSREKGKPRADHKHNYKIVVLHKLTHSKVRQTTLNEYLDIAEVCEVCGRIGKYTQELDEIVNTKWVPYPYPGNPSYGYYTLSLEAADKLGLEHWYTYGMLFDWKTAYKNKEEALEKVINSN